MRDEAREKCVKKGGIATMPPFSFHGKIEADEAPRCYAWRIRTRL
jgi:hypothetical protein